MADTKAVKPATKPIELAIGNCFGIYFLAVSLVDYSAVLFAQGGKQDYHLAFYGMYRQFKMAPPVQGLLELLMLPMIPFLLYGMIKNMLASLLGWEKAYFTRHLVDVIQGIMLPFLILPCIFVKVIPQGTACAEACVLVDGKIGATCQGIVDDCEKTCLFMCMANLIMFICDVTRYNVGAPEAPAAAAIEEKKKDK